MRCSRVVVSACGIRHAGSRSAVVHGQLQRSDHARLRCARKPHGHVCDGLGTRAAIRRYGPIGTVWLAGGLLLFLRLVTKSIDVSGHMSWAILMGAQCSIERLPGWFTLFVSAVGIHVLLLKLLVLGGNSGQYGVLAGCGLAAMLWAATRPTARLDGE